MNGESGLNAQVVRLTWDDGDSTECALADFLSSYVDAISDDEVEALRAGDRVALGHGGDEPLCHVEIVKAMTPTERVDALRHYVAHGSFRDGSFLYCPITGRTLADSERTGISAALAASRGAA